MNEIFEVVTDVAEISRLNKQLAKKLRDTFRYKEDRKITYPSGQHTGAVYFEASKGVGIRAWSPRVTQEKLLNFLMSSEPGSTKRIEISVQLNFPADKYNRRMAGAFVKDSNGDIFVAHRGKLTKGNAGLPKDKVFREFAASTIDATDNKKISRVIVISGLEDPELADYLWKFAEEAREVATRLGEELYGNDQRHSSRRTPSDGNVLAESGNTDEKKGENDDRRSESPADRLLRLQQYYDEHSGEGHTKGRSGGRRVVEHGAIVRNLELLLRSRGSSQKAQAIDLAIVTKSKVDLFEIKTSARTTDVYTGVGQLLIHGECIKEQLGLTVKRYLVLPGPPKDSHSRVISRKANIKVITYQKKGSKYEFSGLN